MRMNSSNEQESVVAVMGSSSMNDFYIGLILATSSTIFIGTSFIFTKKGLLQLSVRAGHGGYGYLKQWMWWAGLILMGVGEAANFAAYAFAPATLVTPLGALSVLVSSVLSSRYLNEKLNLLGKLGCILCILGSVVVIIHAPKEQELRTMSELVSKMHNANFIIYAVFVASLAIFLIFYASPRWGHSNPLVYITITGTIGSMTVIFCKGLGVAIKQTVGGSSQLSNPVTWMIVITVIVCIVIQMAYLNRALDVFNTAVVTPLLYVVFTGCVILASAILFKEWANLGGDDVVGNFCGLVVIVIGIFLVQGLRDVNISWHNLPRARKETTLSSPSAKTSVNGDIIGRRESSLSDLPLLESGLKKTQSMHNGLAGSSYHVRNSSFS